MNATLRSKSIRSEAQQAHTLRIGRMSRQVCRKLPDDGEILRLRREGLTLGEIGRMYGVSRQAVCYAEQRARRKMSIGHSMCEEHELERAERAEYYRERGQLLQVGDLTHNPAELPAKHWGYRQTLAAKLERVMDRLIAELEAGRLTAEYVWERISGMHAEIEEA